ncbi:SpoIIE family protein phosphatase [Streptomyces sp. NPDC046831]|uniref:SpoIIE family protein phosphatase n=1 Tax=Streptomyces sp. NPDC046831 TaxID=3154805 RepID=UPI00340B3A48
MYPTPADGGRGDEESPAAGIRPEILASWRRSQARGIDREGAALPVEHDLDPDSRLVRAAAPVLERLRERFSGLPVTVTLADARARIVERLGDSAGLALMDAASLVLGANVDERFMGTSSVSMVLSTRAPFVVVGHEHYLHGLKELTCMAAPVRDPVGGTVQGVVNLSVPRTLADPGMALVLQDATDRIGERLLELTRTRERELMRSFRRIREPDGRGAGPDLAPGDLLRPGEPAPRLTAQERLGLLEHAIELISSSGTAYAEVPLAGGRVALLRRRELCHGDAEGAAVEVGFQDAGGAGTPEAVTAIAPGGRHALLSAPGTATATDTAERTAPVEAPYAADEARADEPGPAPPGADRAADAWLLLVGEPRVGRLAAEARGRLSLLNEAGTRLGTTLDMRQTAEELARIAVPRFADLVVVDLSDGILTDEDPLPGRPCPEVALRRVVVWAGRDVGGAPPGGTEEQPVDYPAGTPQHRCLESGRPVADSVPAGVPADGGHPVGLLGEGTHSYLGAPLSARGCVLGLVGFYRRGGTRPYEQDDLTLAGELAARAATSLDNARRYRRERLASLTLQRSLLPRALPRLRAVDLASRYLPADARAGVGGDWFDAIPLSGTRVALVVGDVPGNGLHAAATMGRLRTAVRTLAAQDLLPEEVLAHLDDLISRTFDEPAGSPAGDQDPATGATCLYAVYDPVSCRCTAARAGHPPPALLVPDEPARVIELPSGPPLGLGGLQPYESTTVDLPTDSLLALYTDGLLKESRGYGDTEVRTAQLLASLDGSGPALEDVCDGVTDALLPGGPRDDVALLLARVHPLPADQVASWEFPSDPSVVSRARALVSAQLAAWDLSDLDFSTGLVVSELVTNAVRYGGQGPIGLRLLRDDALICEVSDRSNTSPRIRRAATTEEGGRGLFLVAQFTSNWGVRYMPQGKTVWAEQLPRTRHPASEVDEQALLALFDEPK